MILLYFLINLFIFKIVYTSTSLTCEQDPKACLKPELVARIEQLSPTLTVEDPETLPYSCFLFAKNTVPYETDCVQCSDKHNGCPPDHQKGKKWDEICAFYCPQNMSTSTLMTATVHPICVSDPKSCIDDGIIREIEILLPHMALDSSDDPELPFKCYALKHYTLPYRDQCVACADQLVRSGCTDSDRTEGQEKVCGLFCSRRISSTTSARSTNESSFGSRPNFESTQEHVSRIHVQNSSEHNYENCYEMMLSMPNNRFVFICKMSPELVLIVGILCLLVVILIFLVFPLLIIFKIKISLFKPREEPPTPYQRV